MAGIISRRTRASAALAAALTALVLTACATDQPTVAATSPGDTEIGGAPSASASASPNGSPSPTGGSTAPVFPKDAKSYALELLKAWAKPDYTRLGQLAIQSAVQQIKDSINFGGLPNSTWTYISCGPGDATGFTNCVYRNAHGDEATIKINNSQLGFPTAVTEAPLNRTEYSNDPGAYAGNFISAWQAGNQQRMARYSSTAIKNYFIGQNPPITAYSQYTPEPCCGSGYVKVMFDGLSSDSGRSYTFKVLASPDKKAFAIKGYCKGYNCTP